MDAWARTDEAIVIADLTACEPASAFSAAMRRGHWRVSTYEAGGIRGKMILACPDAAAPALRLPLSATGPHAIYVGVYTTRTCPSQVWLKLDGDAAPVPRSSHATREYWAMEEVFFKVAKLNGSRLHIIQQATGITSLCGVAYVKLVPLTEREYADVLADRAASSHRRLTATCDGTSFLTVRSPRTVEELLSEVEIYRDTDFSTLMLHLISGDQAYYPSPYGAGAWISSADSFPDLTCRHAAEAMRELERKGINYARVIIDGAHRIGMKVHAGIRPAGWTYYPPYVDMFTSPFYRDHPEWRTIDRDGAVVARMSWAVPEVRQRMIGALADAVSLGADGAHIVFNRGWPMVLYEPAFRDLFHRRHGIDPRTLDEADPRITAVRCEIVKTFFRELRAALDEEQTRRGSAKRLALSVCVLGTEKDNLSYGVDLRRLAGEGLIDEVHVYKYNFGATQRVCDMAYLRQACPPGRVHLSPMFSPGDQTDACVHEALACYEAGADGLGIWDTYCDDIHRFRILARMGHVDELKHLAARGLPEPTFLPVHRIDDEVLDGRFPIFWGG